MKSFSVAVVVVCVLVPGALCASDTIAWCYQGTNCSDSFWPTIAAPFCNGTRQSPINIVSASATANGNLTAFTFQGFDNTSAMGTMSNTGKTVQVNLKPGVKISGGDLSGTYDTLQIHLHWGNGSSVPGSEHTVDGIRYPMELHVVNTKSSYNRDLTLAEEDSTGVAAFGFLIEARTDVTGQPASWKNLTSNLNNISLAGQSVAVTSGISLNDLLVGVDLTKYYRYLGSITTPACNEAVVWTVFKDTIKVSKDLIDLFSTSLHVNDSSSPLMVNVYRNTQRAQPVQTQPSSSSRTGFSLALMALCSVLWWI